MTMTRGASALATAALLLVALTSCTDDANDPVVSPGPTTTSQTSTTATTTPPSETEKASAGASALVKRYYAIVDELGQNVGASLNGLNSVATGVQLSAEQTLLKSQRKDRQRQTGDTLVVKLEVQSVNLDNSDPAAGKVPTVQIDVCWDVSKVDVLDANGKSIVSPNRPDTGWTRLTIANYHYRTDPSGGWRVATGQDLTRDPCAAS